jgi:hypothetical protein
MGGCFTDSQGKPIIYDPKASTINELGNICISERALHERIISELITLNCKI